MYRKVVLFLLIVVLATASVLLAQRGGFFGRDNFRGGRFRAVQNDPPPTEFVFARLHYQNNGRRGGGGWGHDYPAAEEHILQIMAEASGLNVEHNSYKIVELGSKELFNYPFAYVSEPGEMELSDQEVVNLREYIDRGGFMMFDDFDGQYDLQNLYRNLKRAFPDREMYKLPDDHPLLHIYYDIDELNVISPYDVGAGAVFYGFPNKDGELAMVICWNNDVGDFWEWIDEPRYALKPSAESLRLGVNFVIYSMTH